MCLAEAILVEPERTGQPSKPIARRMRSPSSEKRRKMTHNFDVKECWQIQLQRCTMPAPVEGSRFSPTGSSQIFDPQKTLFAEA